MFVQCQNVAVTGSPLPAHVVQLHGSTKRKPLSNHRQIVLGLYRCRLPTNTRYFSQHKVSNKLGIKYSVRNLIFDVKYFSRSKNRDIDLINNTIISLQQFAPVNSIPIVFRVKLL